MLDVVWGVGANVGWPLEVFALFTTETAARQHAELAAYSLDVFPIRVYASYDDCPPILRNTGESFGVEEVLANKAALECQARQRQDAQRAGDRPQPVCPR